MEDRGNNEVQICAIDESCRSSRLHNILNLRWSPEYASIYKSQKSKRTRSCTSSVGVRLMNRISCGVSNKSRRHNTISKQLSRGGSIRATRSSKYPLTPVKCNLMREGRTERVGGGRRRLSRFG